MEKVKTELRKREQHLKKTKESLDRHEDQLQLV
jgi:hypothetical protein